MGWLETALEVWRKAKAFFCFFCFFNKTSATSAPHGTHGQSASSHQASRYTLSSKSVLHSQRFYIVILCSI